MVISGNLARPGWALVIPWDTSNPGGVTQVVLNLAQGLKTHGAYAPIVIVQDWAALQPRREMRDGIQHIFIRMRAAPGKSDRLLRHILHPLLLWKEQGPLARLLLEFRIQVVNFHYPTLAAEEFALDSRVRGNAKLIFSLHGTDVREIIGRGAEYRARYVRMLASGDAVVAVSHGFADEVAKDIVPEINNKLSVIYNGVSAKMLHGHEKIGIRLPSHYILNVGHFREIKGQRYLIDAFSQIAGYYSELHLVMAGQPSDALDGLIEQTQQLGLTERVLFLQEVPHEKIGALFASATLFCMSSLAESFGIVLLEAGLFTLPVVASRVGAAPEIIRDGKDGILVEPGNPTQLAAALRAVLDAPTRSGALAASLHDRVMNEFGWQTATERYVALVAAMPGRA